MATHSRTLFHTRQVDRRGRNVRVSIRRYAVATSIFVTVIDVAWMAVGIASAGRDKRRQAIVAVCTIHTLSSACSNGRGVISALKIVDVVILRTIASGCSSPTVLRRFFGANIDSSVDTNNRSRKVVVELLLDESIDAAGTAGSSGFGFFIL